VLERPLRVLQVVGRADRGGAETWLLHVLRHIDRKQVALDFLVHDRVPGAYDAEIRARGSKIFVCENHRNIWRQFWGLRRVLRDHGPFDAVHSHVDYFSGVIVLLARLLGVRIRIANCHNDHPAVDHSIPLRRRLYILVMKRFIDWFATAGVAPSRAAAAALFGPEWQSDSRWGVQSVCIDLHRFSYPAEQRDVRAELNVPADAIVFGHVGRFVEQKNHDFLIRLAEILVSSEPLSRFLLVGSGPTEERVKKAIVERGMLDRFILLPPRDDIPRLMLGAFDYFLFPSRYEGLGLALVEAQAAGLRCFASMAIPPEAIVIPSLVQQLPLSAGPEYWAEAILRQMGAPNPVTREEALRKVGQSFDIRQNAAQLVEYYQAAVS